MDISAHILSSRRRVVLKDYIRERVLKIFEILKNEDLTVREIANKIRMSKSAVHTDLTTNLKKIDLKKYEEAKSILKRHSEEGVKRGADQSRYSYTNLTPSQYYRLGKKFIEARKYVSLKKVAKVYGYDYNFVLRAVKKANEKKANEKKANEKKVSDNK